MSTGCFLAGKGSDNRCLCAFAMFLVQFQRSVTLTSLVASLLAQGLCRRHLVPWITPLGFLSALDTLQFIFLLHSHDCDFFYWAVPESLGQIMPLAPQNPAVYGAVSSGASRRPEPGRKMETGCEKTKRRLRSVLLHAVFAAYPPDRVSFLFSIALCFVSSI